MPLYRTTRNRQTRRAPLDIAALLDHLISWQINLVTIIVSPLDATKYQIETSAQIPRSELAHLDIEEVI